MNAKQKTAPHFTLDEDGEAVVFLVIARQSPSPVAVFSTEASAREFMVGAPHLILEPRYLLDLMEDDDA